MVVVVVVVVAVVAAVAVVAVVGVVGVVGVVVEVVVVVLVLVDHFLLRPAQGGFIIGTRFIIEIWWAPWGAPFPGLFGDHFLNKK